MVETAENSGTRARGRSQNVKAHKPRISPGKPLNNPKHELFAQAIARGADAPEAFVQVGFMPNRHNASRLKTSEPVRNRIAEIQTEMARQTIAAPAIDKAYVLSKATKLFEACETALEAEFDPKAANVASRFLDQIGRHVDVQAFREAQDINVHITVDQAIARLESQAIEADYEVIDDTAD
jgi:hypothetical protein